MRAIISVFVLLRSAAYLNGTFCIKTFNGRLRTVLKYGSTLAGIRLMHVCKLDALLHRSIELRRRSILIWEEFKWF